MDKALRALALAEENAAAVAALRKRGVRAVVGTTADGHTAFGTAERGVAIVFFGGSAAYALYSNGKKVAESVSPIVAEIERGALHLSAVASNARAVIIG